MMQAESYIDMGYQRILTFERPGGGFDWWGNGPALLWLSAYGVQQLTATSRVREIDTGVIDRASQFLAGKQGQDGSWGVVGDTHGETIAQVQNPSLALTAYVAWSLAESGQKGDALTKALAYLKKHGDKAQDNPYLLSLMANAFVFGAPQDPMTAKILDQLDRMKQSEGDTDFWSYSGRTATSAYGNSANVESTGMALYAMLAAQSHPATATRALNYLVKAKGPGGTWGSTQATILALKCLVASEVLKTQGGKAEVKIYLDDKPAGTWNIDDDNRDVMQQLDMPVNPGKHALRMEVNGDANVMYQMVTRYFEPWERVKTPERKTIEIDVSYDRTRLAQNDILQATATMRYLGERPTFMVILDLGVPPGFSVDPGDFAELVGEGEGKIKRYSITSRQITIYLGDVKPGDIFRCKYHLKAKYPLRAKTPDSTVYEYYSPDVKAVSKPVEIVVTEK